MKASPTAETRMPLVVLVSGSGSNLQKMIDQMQANHLPINIQCVISNQANAYALTRARQANIPAEVIAHTDYDSRETFDRALQERIDYYQPELVVLAGFMRILTPDFVRHYQGKMININPSLLPKYRGLHTHQRALEGGEKVHGTSVHFVTDQLDGGPIIAQAEVPILPEDTPESLQTRVQNKEYQLYPEVIRWYAEKRLRLKNELVYFDNQPIPTTGLKYPLS